MKTKALCIIMIAILLIGQVPINYVLADEVDANATGGGSSSSLTSGNGSLNWSQTHSGYRFTIIDQVGKVVSLGRDGKAGSVDVFFCDYKEIDTPYYFTNSKTEPLSTEKNGSMNKKLTINEFNESADLSSLPPYPISSNGAGSAIGNGKALKLWLMESKQWIGKYTKSTSVSPSSTTSTTTSSSSSTSSSSTVKYDVAEEQAKVIASAKKLQSSLDIKWKYTKSEKLEIVYAWMDAMVVHYTKLNKEGSISDSTYNKILLGTALDMMAYMQSASFTAYPFVTLPKTCSESLIKRVVSANLNLFTDNIEALTSFDDSGRKKLLDCYVEGELNYFKYLYNEGTITKAVYNDAKSSLNELSGKYEKTFTLSSANDGFENVSYVKNNAGETIYTVSNTYYNPVYLSAATTDTNSEEEGEIYKILRARYNKKPLFELAEQSQEEYKGMDTVEIMIEKGYLLLVENLTLIQPATWNSSTQSAGVYFKYQIFGTITNYAEALTLLEKKGLWDDLSGGSYSTPTTKLGWSCLTLENDWEGIGIKIKAPSKTAGTRRTLDELAEASNLSKGVIEGYGMQLYGTVQESIKKETLIRQINIIVSKDDGTEKIIDIDKVDPELTQNPLSTGTSFRGTLAEMYTGGSKLIDWKIVNGLGISLAKSLNYYRKTLKGVTGAGSPVTPLHYGETAIVFYELQKPEVQLIIIENKIKMINGSIVEENMKVSKPDSITDKVEYDDDYNSYTYEFTGTPSKAKNFKSKLVDGLNLTGSDYDSFGKGITINSKLITGIEGDKKTVVIYYELISNTTEGGSGKSSGDITLAENEIAKGVKNVITSTDSTYRLTATFDGYPTDSVGCGQNYILTSNKSYSIKYKCSVEDESTGQLIGLDSDIVYTGQGSPFVGKRASADQFKSGTITATNDEQTKTYKPDYDLTVYRGKDADTVTLAEYYYTKNGKDSYYKELSNVLGFKAANKLTTPRAEVSGWFSSSYKLASMVFSLTEDSDTTAVYYGASKCDGHTRWIPEVTDEDGNVTSQGYNDSYTKDHGSTPDTTINAESKSKTAELDVAINNYMGTENSGTSNSSDNNKKETFKVGSITFINNSLSKAYGYSINNEKPMLFNPYIKMKYSTASDPSNWSYAYILSEYRSTINNSDYVDIGFNKPVENSLILDSNQWTTNKRAVSALGKDSVLPAGAVFTLKADPNNKTYVGLKVWQTYVDSDMSDVVTNYDYYKKSEVDARRDTLVDNVKKTIEGYDVVQYIAQGILSSKSDVVSDGVMLDTSGTYGTELTKVFGNKVNDNSKYYLKLGGNTTSSSGSIDIVSTDTNTVTWTIKSDTSGKVTVYKNGSAYNSISKTQGLSDLLNGDAALEELNTKTKLLSNFLSALDRNSGDNAWYNEAVDGVSVVVTDYLYEVGFKTGSATRSAALDTALAGKLDSKSDLFNFAAATADEKVRTSLFRTSPRSSAVSKAFGNAYIATWGEENIDIKLDGIANMLSSKIFYLGNATVQDLD